MFEWMKRRRSTPPNESERDTDQAKGRRSACGQYQSLYKYLNDRYAKVVVLTFSEIEALLGFPLPDVARLSQDWWTVPDPNGTRPRFADSWILANRTAQPNLQAMTVVFDRES